LELDVRDVVCLDVQKNQEGTRSLGKFAQLQSLNGERVLVIDDGTVSGNLLRMTADQVRELNGNPKTCALVSEGRCHPPDFLAEVRDDISQFPWRRVSD
jgi:orotate phosphoribosyltransferase-like protein